MLACMCMRLCVIDSDLWLRMVANGSADPSALQLSLINTMPSKSPFFSNMLLIVRSLMYKTLDVKCDWHIQGLYRLKVTQAWWTDVLQGKKRRKKKPSLILILTPGLWAVLSATCECFNPPFIQCSEKWKWVLSIVEYPSPAQQSSAIHIHWVH